MNTFLQGISNLVNPFSSYFIEENTKLFSVKEFEYSENLKTQILPGDIVLTRTPSKVHTLVRKLTQSEFDHIAVFLNQNQVVHISPPQIRLITSSIFLMEKYSPIILRPNLNQSEIKVFLEILLNSEKKQYDYNATLKIIGYKFINNLLKIEQLATIHNNPAKYSNEQSQKLKEFKNETPHKMRQRYMCSDLIMYSLALASENFRNVLKNSIIQLDYQKIGSFTPDDFLKIFINDETKFLKNIHGSSATIKQFLIKKQKLNPQQQLITRDPENIDNKYKFNQKQKNYQNNRNENNNNEQYQRRKTIYQNISDDVKIIFDNPQETENFFVKTKSIVDKMLFIANFNKVFNIKFINQLFQIRMKQKQRPWFSKNSNTSLDNVFLTLKILYHLYHLKQVTGNYKDFFNNKSKVILHLGSLLLAINAITYPEENRNLSFISQIPFPKM